MREIPLTRGKVALVRGVRVAQLPVSTTRHPGGFPSHIDPEEVSLMPLNEPEPHIADDQQMDAAAYQDLVMRASTGKIGESVGFRCTVDPTDCLHMIRAGDIGDRDRGRVVVGTMSAAGPVSVYFSPSLARKFAAQLMNLADELDGYTPLNFVPEDDDPSIPRPIDRGDQ